MAFRDYAKPHIAKIEFLLANELENLHESSKKDFSKVLDLVNMFAVANKGGSRLRGVLLILGFETAGGKNVAEAAKAAVALELFQTAILAQDDFMDKSELRRGIPALYRAIAVWHAKRRMNGNSLHFGISQAISLSDVGFFLASDAIIATDFPDSCKLKALSSFNRLVVDTGFGQILDLTLPALTSAKTTKDILTVERYKTAQYTAVGPLVMGAYLAGAGENLICTMRNFGENLGIAFQIQDDIKGVFGNPEITGKSAKEDIIEGKWTLLFVHALKYATASQKKVLGKLYGKSDLSEKEAECVREIFRSTGALRYAVRQSRVYANRAVLSIPQISKDHSAQSIYTSLVDYVLAEK